LLFHLYYILSEVYKRKNPDQLSGKIRGTPIFFIFLHPDYTVGFGISPNQRFSIALGLYRRWGHSPRPKSCIGLLSDIFGLFSAKMRRGFAAALRRPRPKSCIGLLSNIFGSFSAKMRRGFAAALRRPRPKRLTFR